MPDSGSSISPQSIFCLVLRLMYPAVAHGRCTTDPNTLEAACSCHLLISPVKQATGSHAPFSGPGQGARTFPLESYVSAHYGIFVPERELPALLPASQTTCSLLWVMGWAFSFLFLESAAEKVDSLFFLSSGEALSPCLWGYNGRERRNLKLYPKGGINQEVNKTDLLQHTHVHSRIIHNS